MSTVTLDAPGVVVVVRAPSTELDLATSGVLDALLRGAHEPRATVVLDLADVVFVDSAALAVVLAAQRRQAAAGGRLALAHPSPRVLRVLRLCGFAELLLPSSAPRGVRPLRSSAG